MTATATPQEKCALRLASQFPKRCGCGRSHVRGDWAALPFIGKQVDDFEAIDLRNCPCGSTLAVLTAVFRSES